MNTEKILVGGFTQEALNELARAIRMAKHRPPKGRRYGERDNVLLTERNTMMKAVGSRLVVGSWFPVWAAMETEVTR